MAAVETRRLRLKGPDLLCTLILGCLGLVVLTPLLLLFLSSFELERPGRASAYGLENWVLALTDPGLVRSITNTLARTFVILLLSFPVGVLLSWILARTDLPGRRWIEFMFWVTFLMPLLPVTLGWIVLMDPEFGLLNQFLREWFSLQQPVFNIYSFGGIIWVILATRAIATKVILLTPLFRSMDASLEEASLVCGVKPLRTALKIFLPLMAPSLTVVLIMSAIHSIESFEVEQVLGIPFMFYVYSTKIYELIHLEPVQFGAASALGVLIMLAIVPLIVWQHQVSIRRHYVTVTGKYRSKFVSLGIWRWPAFTLAMGSVVLFAVVPFGFLVVSSLMRFVGFFDLPSPYTTDQWKRVLTDSIFLSSLKNSVVLGLGNSIAAILVYSIIAYVVVKSKYFGRGVIDFLSWLPITVPGIVMGLGFLWLFLRLAVFRPMYGTIFAPMFVTVLSSMTLGVQLFKAHLLQISDELEEAGWVSGGSRLYTFRHVVLRLLGPTIATVGAVAFASAVRNVSHVAPLVTQSNRPLSLLQLDYIVDGRYESAAAVGVIIVLMTTGIVLTVRLLARVAGWREEIEEPVVIRRSPLVTGTISAK